MIFVRLLQTFLTFFGPARSLTASNGAHAMQEDDSQIKALIAQIEAYAADPTKLDSEPASNQCSDWLQDKSKRTEAAAQFAEELIALQSIYTDNAVHLLKVTNLGAQADSFAASETVSERWLLGSTVTITITTECDSQDCPEPIPLKLAATLPPFYPHSSKPPQLQLLSKYVGGYSVDSALFGEVLRALHHYSAEHDSNSVSGSTPIDDDDIAAWIGGSMDTGVRWQPGEVILFEGIEWVKEKVLKWWASKESARIQGGGDKNPRPGEVVSQPVAVAEHASIPHPGEQIPATEQAFAGKLFVTDPIVDRKSEFVGYAATLSSPDDVPVILSHILKDKRVARAAHPTINAWVCRTQPDSSIVHRDCDDDGETAAGGRLAHLLSILELENVIVVVTRWFGGIHLGPDRFKLINRAAREALYLGGFLGKTASVANQITNKSSIKHTS